MKYMMLIAGSRGDWATRTDEENAAYQRVDAWWGEQAAAGTIVEGHQLEPSPTATTVRIGLDGGTTVTDGPFVEGKELVGGYGILDVPDLDAALAGRRHVAAPGRRPRDPARRRACLSGPRSTPALPRSCARSASG